MPKGGKKQKMGRNPISRGGSTNKVGSHDSGHVATRSRSVLATVAMEAAGKKDLSGKRRKVLDSSVPPVKRSKVAKQINFDANDGSGVNNNAKPAVTSKEELLDMSKHLLDCNDGVRVAVNESEEEELDYYDDVDDQGEGSGSSMMDQDQEDQFVAGQSSSNKQVGQQPTNAMAADDLNALMNDPRFRSVFNKMWDEKVKEAQDKGETSASVVLTAPTPGKGSRPKGNIYSSKQQKSPSDTTIYAPALNRQHRQTVAQQIGSPMK